MRFKNIINYFIPAKYAHDKELNRKSKFIVWFIIITGLIGVLFGILTDIQNPANKANAFMAMLIIPLFTFVLLHFRKKGSFVFTTHFVCSIFTVAMALMPDSSGGLFSPDMPTIYILPIFALIMSNYRIALFYAALTVCIFVGYYIIALNDASVHFNQLSTLSSDYFFLNLLLNFLVIVFLVFRNENIRQKILGELKESHQIISQKSKEITDSINYAKRIQTAILPDDSIVKQHFPNSFILYLPKDIVSGDFYWMTEKNDAQLIAVADCTGHGVPGALMSVIGVNLLNNIVQEKSITNPSEILEELNQNLKRILKQNHHEINDGMDIAVLKVNTTTKSLEYAGANRSLYYVRSGILTEIKPTKMPIGGYDYGKDMKFAATQLELQKGDMVYLSTDGYADQFGTEKNIKITTKKFKAQLENNAALDLAEQQHRLLEFFESFKTDYEQTDDVLVVGLRF